MRTISLRLILGVALLLLSIAGGLILSGSEYSTAKYLVASEDIPSDHLIEPSATTAVELATEAETARHLLRVDERDLLEGAYSARPILAGEPITRSALTPRPTPVREVSFELSSAGLKSNGLKTGDRVDIVATLDKGTPAARTLVLARGAKVVTVGGGADEDSPFGASGATSAVVLTVAVEGREALSLAFGYRNGEIDVFRSMGPDFPLPDGVDHESIGSNA